MVKNTASATIERTEWFKYWIKCLFIFLILNITVAVLSQGFHQADEHFQTIEFASYKIGTTTAANLPWEFGAKIRSWLQPSLYFLLIRASHAVGVQNPFDIETILRIFSSLLAFFGFAAISFQLRYLVPQFKQRKTALILFLSFYFFPILNARTSSENFSAVFLMFAAATALEIAYSRSHWIFAFLFGACCALSFEARFQSALVTGGLALWLLLNERKSIPKILLGALLALLGCIMINRWGYGRFEFPAFHYFNVNIMHDKASYYGTAPWWAYFKMFFRELAFPYGILLMLGMFCSFFSSSRYFFLCLLVPFTLAHFFIPHKELRFLFPVFWGYWLLFVLKVYLPYLTRFNWLKVHLVISAIFLVVYGFKAKDPLIPLAENVWQFGRDQNSTLLVTNITQTPFFIDVSCKPAFIQPPDLVVKRIGDRTELMAAHQSFSQFLFLEGRAEDPLDPQNPPMQGCELINSTKPKWVSWVARLNPAIEKHAFKGFYHYNLFGCKL